MTHTVWFCGFCKTWKKKADGRKSLQEPDESEFFSKDYMEEKEEGPIQHHENCEFCKDAGELILCEYCPRLGSKSRSIVHDALFPRRFSVYGP